MCAWALILQAAMGSWLAALPAELTYSFVNLETVILDEVRFIECAVSLLGWLNLCIVYFRLVIYGKSVQNCKIL